MKKCQTCKSERMANLYAKCSDLCNVSMSSKEHDGYVPDDMGIGGGDDVSFTYCLDCGQIQGKFPLDSTELEEQEEESSSDDEEDTEYKINKKEMSMSDFLNYKPKA